MRKASVPVYLVLTALITLTSINYAASANSLLNRPCKKVGTTTTNLNKKLTCVSVSGIKIWKLTPKLNQPQLAKELPTIVPNFSLKYQNNKVTATVIINGQDLKSASIDGAEAIIYAKIDGNYNKIGTSSWKVLAENYVTGSLNVNFNFPLAMCFLIHKLIKPWSSTPYCQGPDKTPHLLIKYFIPNAYENS